MVVPTRSGWWRVPPQLGLDGGGVGNPIPGLDGGYSIPGLDREGTPEYPPARSGWWGRGTQGTPWPDLDGGGLPSQVWMVGGVPGVPPCPDLVWGTPPHQDLGWGSPLP